MPAKYNPTIHYATEPVKGRDLTAGHTLVGESGGLSVIYEVENSDALPGMLAVQTEHGPLYLDPDEAYDTFVG